MYTPVPSHCFSFCFDTLWYTTKSPKHLTSITFSTPVFSLVFVEFVLTAVLSKIDFWEHFQVNTMLWVNHICRILLPIFNAKGSFLNELFFPFPMARDKGLYWSYLRRSNNNFMSIVGICYCKIKSSNNWLSWTLF